MKTIQIISVVFLLLLVACAPGTIVVEQGDDSAANAISVQGSSEFEVSPDEAEVLFGVETRSFDAKAAQEQNRVISNAVQQALLSVGVSKTQMETLNYNMYRETKWDNDRQESVEVGYVVSNNLKVKTSDLDAVGRIIDAAAQAGVNNVQSVQFSLSKSREKETKAEALALAASNAREKAQALASGLGVRLGSLRSVSESSFAIYPYGRYDAMAMSVKAESAPTPIVPGSVSVSAQVSVAYNIG